MVHYISTGSLSFHFFNLFSKAVWETPRRLAASRMLREAFRVSMTICFSYVFTRSFSEKRPEWSKVLIAGGFCIPWPISWLKRMHFMSMTSPSARKAARSTTFFSSLTLPGQSCRINLRIASLVIACIGLSSFEECRRAGGLFDWRRRHWHEMHSFQSRNWPGLAKTTGNQNFRSFSSLFAERANQHIRKADHYGNLAGLSKHPRSRQTSRHIPHGRAEQIKKMET